MEFGTQAEVFELAPQRHSALTMVSGFLLLKLTRRKHRPEGSILKRSCRCREVGRLSCVVCTYLAWVAEKQPGTGSRVWPGSASQYLHQLRRLLNLLMHPQAMSFTLKCFRAGKASVLASSGATWQEIQSAGEWRGLSSLSYINRQAIDDYASFTMSVEASSDEEVEKFIVKTGWENTVSANCPSGKGVGSPGAAFRHSWWRRWVLRWV